MSVDLFTKFAQDPAKLKEGVWINISDAEGVPGRIKVGRYGSPAYNDALKRHALEMKREVNDSKNLTEAEWDEVATRAAAETLILDWEDITLNGQEVKYSYELALKILQMEEMETFRNFIQIHSMNSANFALADTEELSKKL